MSTTLPRIIEDLYLPLLVTAHGELQVRQSFDKTPIVLPRVDVTAETTGPDMGLREPGGEVYGEIVDLHADHRVDGTGEESWRTLEAMAVRSRAAVRGLASIGSALKMLVLTDNVTEERAVDGRTFTLRVTWELRALA